MIKRDEPIKWSELKRLICNIADKRAGHVRSVTYHVSEPVSMGRTKENEQPMTTIVFIVFVLMELDASVWWWAGLAVAALFDVINKYT